MLPQVSIKSEDGIHTEVSVNDNKIPNVTHIGFNQSVGELPTFFISCYGAPNINAQAHVDIIIDNETLTDSISILRHELLQHTELYNGFIGSIKAALENQNEYGIPFEPTEDIAQKILDYLIGEHEE